MKSELAEEYDKFLASPDGQICTSRDIICLSSYEQILKRRIKKAFLAGAKANEKVGQSIANKLIKELRMEE